MKNQETEKVCECCNNLFQQPTDRAENYKFRHLCYGCAYLCLTIEKEKKPIFDYLKKRYNLRDENSWQQDVRDFMTLAEQETPESPRIPEDKVRLLRAKLLFEEFLETLDALGVYIYDNQNEDEGSGLTIEHFDFVVSPMYHSWDQTKIMADLSDGIGDSLVVLLGTAIAYGINMDEIWKEIHRSNMSKFIDGTKRTDGKYVKGPSYSPVNLKPIIEAQIKEKGENKNESQ